MSFLHARAAIVAASALFAGYASAQQNIRVTVNGDPVTFQSTSPKYLGGRVMVPVRGVFEHLGAFVEWHPETRTVTATKSNTDIKLAIGNRTAWVNGEGQTLDVPASLIGGRTMVPLRFISEALGANVEWSANDRLVTITTSDSTTGNQNRVDSVKTMRRFALLNAGAVIPVELNNSLSSNGSNKGDRFTATVKDANRDEYAELPAGTVVEGRVVSARPQKGNDPGLLELEFTRIRMPDGTSHAIDGSLISLASDSVVRNADGVLVARNDKKDDRLVYAGVGAGAGLIIGVLTKKPLEGTVLGGVLGYLYGENKRKNDKPSNVVLNPGTEFGVRLDKDVLSRR